jgi:RHS repeat-associated protein
VNPAGNRLGIAPYTGSAYYWEMTYVRAGAWLIAGNGNATGFYHLDALGSVRETTNYAGSAGEDLLIYPWGLTWAAVLGVTGYDMNFASMPHNDWVANGVTSFRFYNHGQGRWLSPDPLAGSIFNPQSLNRYAYVLNNPTTFTDPTGLECDSGKDGVIHCTVSAPTPNAFLDEFFFNALFGFSSGPVNPDPTACGRPT